MPRVTYDSKDRNIRVRINEETREYLETLSKETGKSVSEVIRVIINESRSRKEYIQDIVSEK